MPSCRAPASSGPAPLDGDRVNSRADFNERVTRLDAVRQARGILRAAAYAQLTDVPVAHCLYGTAMATVLILPGLNNSGPSHWQSLWLAAHPEYCRVVQKD
jgi:hypothetical protein